MDCGDLYKFIGLFSVRLTMTFYIFKHVQIIFEV